MELRALGRRVKIARLYAEYDDRHDLAAAINQPGLSAAVLGRIERGEKQPAIRDLETIARECGVSSLWLTNEEYDPFKGSLTPDPEGVSGSVPAAVVHALEELLESRDPHSAALEELRQLRERGRPANGKSEPGRA